MRRFQPQNALHFPSRLLGFKALLWHNRRLWFATIIEDELDRDVFAEDELYPTPEESNHLWTNLVDNENIVRSKWLSIHDVWVLTSGKRVVVEFNEMNQSIGDADSILAFDSVNDGRRTKEDVLKLFPSGSSLDQWATFVEYHMSPEFKVSFSTSSRIGSSSSSPSSANTSLSGSSSIVVGNQSLRLCPNSALNPKSLDGKRNSICSVLRLEMTHSVAFRSDGDGETKTSFCNETSKDVVLQRSETGNGRTEQQNSDGK
ncbi:hypothetical protein G2W53_000633 [Senna tora]|uniref:Uncharacterized protein n=1 Tax=Senna tora TaxID=362788 RepID=A0A834XEB6_9FABA|nr:hypothetical protein G2W53_000633 [Senna tora]